MGRAARGTSGETSFGETGPDDAPDVWCLGRGREGGGVTCSGKPKEKYRPSPVQLAPGL